MNSWARAPRGAFGVDLDPGRSGDVTRAERVRRAVAGIGHRPQVHVELRVRPAAAVGAVGQRGMAGHDAGQRSPDPPASSPANRRASAGVAGRVLEPHPGGAVGGLDAAPGGRADGAGEVRLDCTPHPGDAGGALVIRRDQERLHLRANRARERPEPVERRNDGTRAAHRAPAAVALRQAPVAERRVQPEQHRLRGAQLVERHVRVDHVELRAAHHHDPPRHAAVVALRRLFHLLLRIRAGDQFVPAPGGARRGTRSLASTPARRWPFSGGTRPLPVSATAELLQYDVGDR